jgi:hypothetical protein
MISFKDAIISNIEVADSALWFDRKGGPNFGDDIITYSSKENTNYNDIYYQRKYYEKGIRNYGKFSIENYEVFHLTRR